MARMKRRPLHRFGYLACLLVLSLALVAPVSAHYPSGEGARLAAKPEPVEAPRKSTDPKSPSPGKGFVPPTTDLSHLTGQRMPRVSLTLASSFDWRTTGKVTSVKNQGGCGSCYAFAALANIESRLLVEGESSYDFSENNAKECNWYARNSVGASCVSGNYELVASFLSKQGTVLESCDPYVASDVSCKATCPYQKTLLDWRIICGDAVPSTGVLQSYIQAYGPVYTSLYAGYGDAWETEFQGYDGTYTLYYTGTEEPNHAVLIVGWDDSLVHAGGTGAWIVKNSWGTSWGGTCGYGAESGYFTIAYGSASIGKYSSFMYDWQDYDSNGGLMYYDEGGWRGSTGGWNTTAWGLCKFIPSENTYVTRVEFWTSDATTDVDVYLYDDFDTSTTSLSNILHSELNHSFDEAGYHSIEVIPPLPVTTGDDIIAVMEFTNVSYTYPVVVDNQGPSETQRTYLSSSGSDGSWTDLGVTYNDDAAIRLRTSSTAPTATPTATATETLTPTPTAISTATLTPSPSTTVEPVEFEVVPASQTVSVNGVFTVTLRIQAGAQLLDAAQAYLDYVPAYLNVQSMTGSGVLDAELQNTYNNSLGELGYAAATFGSPVSGTFDLVTVTFQAISSTVGTTLDFHTSSPRLTKARLSTTVLTSSMSSGLVTVLSVTPTPTSSPTTTPTGAVTTPTATQTPAGTIPTPTITNTPTRTFTPTATHTAGPSPTPSAVLNFPLIMKNYGAVLPPTVTPTATVTFCDELVKNGGFELDTSDWTFPITEHQGSRSNADPYVESYSARLGIVPPDPYKWSHSTVYQSVVIPADALLVELSFWYKPFTEGTECSGTEEISWEGYDPQRFIAGMRPKPGMAGIGTWQAYDLQLMMILDSNYGILETVMGSEGCVSNSQTWTQVTHDLTSYRGQTIVLYFDAYNNGWGGGRTWMYVDDVSVQSCDIPTLVPTHTPTPTRTRTPTPTCTPSVTPTPTKTYTPTTTPSVTPSPTYTTTPTPTKTYTPTATPSVTPSPTYTTTPTPTKTYTPTTTPSVTPSMTPSPTYTATPTPSPTLPPTWDCENVILNGDFEDAESEVWERPILIARAEYSIVTAHEGVQSMRCGIVHPTLDTWTESSVYQTVAIPADAERVELTFWYKPYTEDTEWSSAGGLNWEGYDPADAILGREVHRDLNESMENLWSGIDSQQCLILAPGSYGVLAEVLRVNSDSRIWTEVTYDLGAYRGQSIVIYFNVINNGIGNKRTWMYVDDVEVNVCYWATVTPPPPTPTLPSPYPAASRDDGETLLDRLVRFVTGR